MTTTPADLDARLIEAWRRDWDAMMSVYLPGSAWSSVLETVERARSRSRPRVLDLGSGPGTVAERILHRWPTSDVTLVEVDPVLLALARAALPSPAAVVDTDLATPAWTATIGGDFDVVLAVMTLHYFPPHRIRALYHEIRLLLRPHGILLVVDDMPLPGSPPGPAGRPANPGSASAWMQWWQPVRAHPAMAPLLARRAGRLDHRQVAEFTAPATWHCAAAHAAGYADATVRWRHGTYAAVAAVA